MPSHKRRNARCSKISGRAAGRSRWPAAVAGLVALALPQLALQMIDAGLKAYLTCVDPSQCPAEFAGRLYDHQLLNDLPESVDACGEHGEFHSFVIDGPMFNTAIDVKVGETIERDGFVFTDVMPVFRHSNGMRI